MKAFRKSPNYRAGIANLRENLAMFKQPPLGKVARKDLPLANISAALIVVLDALHGLEVRVEDIEKQLEQSR